VPNGETVTVFQSAIFISEISIGFWRIWHPWVYTTSCIANLISFQPCAITYMKLKSY